jgi:large subunit ribosomal protein L15
MKLNSISSADGSRKVGKRVGRGHSAGQGKTCGTGHKGQKSRSGGYHKVGFEGGQMPIHRRLPKVGFASRSGAFSEEVRLSEINKLTDDLIDVDALKRAGFVSPRVLKVKIILSGTVEKALKIKGLSVTKGAKAAIEAAGGSIED